MLLGRGPTIQIYIAGNGALHSCGWRVILMMTALKLQSHWNAQIPFPGPRIVSKFTRPLFPHRGWGLGTRLGNNMVHGIACSPTSTRVCTGARTHAHTHTHSHSLSTTCCITTVRGVVMGGGGGGGGRAS